MYLSKESNTTDSIMADVRPVMVLSMIPDKGFDRREVAMKTMQQLCFLTKEMRSRARFGV